MFSVLVNLKNHKMKPKILFSKKKGGGSVVIQNGSIGMPYLKDYALVPR